MSAMRWGKTAGAYEIFAHIFGRELPIVIECNSPLSRAANIRDAIHYAYDNSLSGGEWYKKVTVSPQENCTVIIKAKPMYAEELSRRA